MIQATRLLASIFARVEVQRKYTKTPLTRTQEAFNHSTAPSNRKQTSLTPLISSWLRPIIQSFVNAENVSLAHLLYEARLLEQSNPQNTHPSISGQAFIVTDPNPAVSFGDIYTLLTTLSSTPVAFPPIQPVPLLLLSYLIEAYVYVQHAVLPWLLPKLTGDLLQIQPSLFAISDVFCIADDERARKGAEEGGLGYRPIITTLEGLCKELAHWNEKVDAKRVAEVKGKVLAGAVSLGEEGVDLKLVSPEMKL